MLIAAFKPSAQRRLCLARTPPGKKTFDAEVFVQLRPVDALTFSDEPPVSPFRWAAMCESWIPCQRNGDRTTIDECDHQRIICK